MTKHIHGTQLNSGIDTHSWITLRWICGTRYNRVQLEYNLWSGWLLHRIPPTSGYSPNPHRAMAPAEALITGIRKSRLGNKSLVGKRLLDDVEEGSNLGAYEATGALEGPDFDGRSVLSSPQIEASRGNVVSDQKFWQQRWARAGQHGVARHQ